MDLRASLLAPCRAENENLDIAALLQRLLLFERCVLKSARLTEVPALVEAFGADAVVHLLNSGALALECSAVAIGDVGQMKALPPFSYAFGTIKLVDRATYLEKWMHPVHRLPGLRKHQSEKLISAVHRALHFLPATFGLETMDGLDRDLHANVPGIHRVVLGEVSRIVGMLVRPADLRVIVHDEGQRTYRVETNILQLGLDQTVAHDTVRKGLFAVANLNQRLEEMKALNSVCGFQGEDLALLEDKVSFFWKAISPEPVERTFARVLRLADFPDFSEAVAQRTLDLNRFLRLRESGECSEFRQWLRTVDEETDEHLAERLRSVREKVALAIHGTAGKVVRLATTTALGLIPGLGPFVGPAASALDTFLVDRVLPKSGPLAFLDQLLPLLSDRA